MKELSIEEKAKAYDMALEMARKELLTCGSTDCETARQIYRFFPELNEGEDERIRKTLIDYFKTYKKQEECGIKTFFGIPTDNILAWLEKRDKVDTVSYEVAENEKREFVGDGFIKCYADFQDFKEGETYWLEYVGKDNYNVRSDNLLGKTYHITPCQLYTIFKKQTWLEKQGEQKPILDFKASNWYVSKVDGQIHDMTYNPTDKAEPKFKVGDWIVNKTYNLVYRVDSILSPQSKCYYLSYNGGTVLVNFVDEQNYRLWTIEDAKDGDVLFHSDSASNGIFIFKELLKYEFSEKVICYCDYDSEDHFCLGEHYTCCWTDAKILHPATKEQRELLFKKMKESGYVWDAEKKELKKIEKKPVEEYNITGIGSKNAQGKLGEMIKNLKPINEVLEQKPKWSEEDEEF